MKYFGMLFLITTTLVLQANNTNFNLPIAKNFLEAKKLSEENSKPIFAFFTHEKNKAISESTINLKLLSEKYIPLIVFSESFEGSTLSEHYKVVDYPTVIILNNKGEILKRTNQVLSNSELSIFLKSQSQEADVNLPNKSSSKSQASKTPQEESNFTPNENISYYGIQTGVYSNYNNASEASDKLSRLFNEKITISEYPKGDETLYKVIIGKYKERKSAEKFNLILLDYNIKGFIKSLSLQSKL